MGPPHDARGRVEQCKAGPLTPRRPVAGPWPTAPHLPQRGAGSASRAPSAGPGPRRIPRFIDIADLLQDSQQGQSVLLLEFLKFRYDELALGFSQSACANPLLMAHLAGLRAVGAGQDYALGIAEHLQQVKAQLRRKPVPAALQALAMETWQDRERHGQRRRLADNFALQGYNLNEEQLACLLFAPFVDRGRNLEHFVQARHPACRRRCPTCTRHSRAYPRHSPWCNGWRRSAACP
ncbi:hypothetical protein NWF32_23130 [Pseudomonas qingdaonensis]|nr:hypothetical protein [Pseudomonas qingdaonensis]